jgi:hypothetical protein
MLRLAIKGRVSDEQRSFSGQMFPGNASAVLLPWVPGMDCLACHLCLLVSQLKVIEAVPGDGVSCSGGRHLASRLANVVRPCRAAAGSRGQRNKKSIADADPSENWWAAL